MTKRLKWDNLRWIQTVDLLLDPLYPLYPVLFRNYSELCHRTRQLCSGGKIWGDQANCSHYVIGFMKYDHDKSEIRPNKHTPTYTHTHTHSLPRFCASALPYVTELAHCVTMKTDWHDLVAVAEWNFPRRSVAPPDKLWQVQMTTYYIFFY